MNKRNFSTYETTERNVRRLRHHSGLSLFHAQPTLTTRLRCDRRHAVKRELSSESSLRSVSLSTSLIVGVATAIIAVGDQAQEGHLVKDHCATQHVTRNQSFHSLVSELCTGVVAGVLGAWCCVDCVGIPREARSGRGTAPGVTLGGGGGLSWPTSKLAGGNPKSWDHWSLGQ